MKGKTIICKECNQELKHHARGMCHKCYWAWYYAKTPPESMRYTKNRSCPEFLGCHVAERMLSNVFKNVKTMPRHNPGYDFICNHGKKIDVKSACLPAVSNAKQRWLFNINYNTVANYFLFIAFDNRKDLNPLHLWLMPGNVVNHQTGVSISKSTIAKWDEYKLDLTKTVKCCTTMKPPVNTYTLEPIPS